MRPSTLFCGTTTAAWSCCVLLCVGLGGCSTPRADNSKTAPTATASPAGGSVDAYAAAVAQDSRASDESRDDRVREQLAAQADSASQACLQLAPNAAACLYYRGVALGMQARAHPLRANELLKAMLESLSAAESADPNFDDAGPARVKALVLTRAPGWPLGPGDADSAVTAARSAVQLKPQHPPNQLALAEALSKSGDAAAARGAYQLAHDLAASLPASADRDDWLRQADKGLHP